MPATPAAQVETRLITVEIARTGIVNLLEAVAAELLPMAVKAGQLEATVLNEAAQQGLKALRTVIATLETSKVALSAVRTSSKEAQRITDQTAVLVAARMDKAAVAINHRETAEVIAMPALIDHRLEAVIEAIAHLALVAVAVLVVHPDLREALEQVALLDLRAAVAPVVLPVDHGAVEAAAAGHPAQVAEDADN